jgi:hypothetical protein
MTSNSEKGQLPAYEEPSTESSGLPSDAAAQAAAAIEGNAAGAPTDSEIERDVVGQGTAADQLDHSTL